MYNYCILFLTSFQTTSYHITVVWSCNVALWDISLLFDELKICLATPSVNTSCPAHLCCGSDTTSRAISEQQQNCPTSPHLKLSHRERCRESAHDSCTQRAVWMGLLMHLITAKRPVQVFEEWVESFPAGATERIKDHSRTEKFWARIHRDFNFNVRSTPKLD